MFRGIRFKLSVVTFVLIAAIITGSFVVVINIIDIFLSGELLKKGFSTARSTATFAGYNITSGDRLALDNLVVKIKQSQKDIIYVAVVGEDKAIKAHSNLELTGKNFSRSNGELIKQETDGSIVRRIKGEDNSFYEFATPILFSDKKIGDIFLGINDDTLISSKIWARRRIILVFVSALAVGVPGIFFLSTLVTIPIRRLTDSISRLMAGKYEGEIRAISRDELGELTSNFNEMAKVIKNQENKLDHYAKELESSYLSMVRILAAAIDARDKYTLGHSTRVAKLALLIGEKLDLKEEELRDLELVCLIHDVGKIRTPDNILNKDARLNGEEYRIIMKHPEHGAEILGLSKSLHKYIPAVLHHHEWYNGNGYPNRLEGDEIPLFALIIATADAYDAMTSSRSYRVGISKESAVNEIIKFKGTQFDPHITDLFLETLRDYENGRSLSFLEMPA